MRTRIFLGAAVVATTLLSGCGGGGSSGSSTAGSSSATYNYTAPKLNATTTYARTIVDNSNNTINETAVYTVTAINSDGTTVSTLQDPTHSRITVDKRIYSVPDETIYGNGLGQDVSYVITSVSPAVTCKLTPHGGGPTYPISIGETWSTSWNRTCGNNAPINYMQTGSVVDTESIIVPAGTFTTFKLQSTTSWTDINGTTHTTVLTVWRNAQSSHWIIQEQAVYSLSGTIPPVSYPVKFTEVLQSHS